MKKGEWRVGTSGWSYEHWKGLFYPEDLPKSRWFGYYTENFDTVEINYTFYSMPKAKTLERWYDITPDDFCFVLKMNRFVTHRKKLNSVEEDSARFFDRACFFHSFRRELGCSVSHYKERWDGDA